MSEPESPDFSGKKRRKKPAAPTQVPAPIARAVETAVSAHGGDPAALLEMLHMIQSDLGFIPREAVPVLGRAINRSRAEIQGVIGFYHDFRSQPAGQITIQLCRAEACQAMGVTQLEHHVKQRLGIGYHETTADGRFSLEPVYCLGNCACTPSIRIGDAIHARVTPERFDELLPMAEES